MTRCVSATHARRERARVLPRFVPDASPSVTHLLLCPVSDEEVGAMELVGRILSQPREPSCSSGWRLCRGGDARTGPSLVGGGHPLAGG